ncbi:MAG TPA: winged helix domain-containing protein, partial [Bordetella sp.]|nr:winged helix domain-containing protein [Bordetella sp.]
DLVSHWPESGALELDRRTRMLYRGRQLFINGETALVAADAALRALADARRLDCADPRSQRLSDPARECLTDWLDAGWLHYRASL